MPSYNPQPILRKKWGITDRGGTIRIKKIRCGKINCSKCPHEFYAYFVYCLLGKYIWRYLGKADNLGRPVKKEGKSDIPLKKKATQAS